MNMYSEKVMEHFRNPRNVGEIPDPDGVGEIGNVSCGDIMKIYIKVDGDVTKLWKNWHNGLHRQTCYGDITKELGFFCRFKEIELVNEAV